MDTLKLGKGTPLTPALCELHYQAEKEIEQEEHAPKVMGLTEVAARLGWKKQQVGAYLKRAEEGRGGFPKPFQRLASGPIWLASDIEAYAERKGV